MFRLNLVPLVHSFFVGERGWKSFVLVSSMRLLVYEEDASGLCVSGCDYVGGSEK